MVKELYASAITYPSPSNLNALRSFGSLGLFFLVVQIITGVLLAMHYVPNAEMAFASVDFIMREVNFGWLLRYLHANGASMFFLVIYIHMARGIYYRSFVYPRHLLWIVGVIISVLMIATAFLGYVPPWGQMSFWAATVITNLFTAIPYIGFSFVEWLWGGFSVNNATLSRFFSLHYLLPFVIFGLAIIHLIFLHEHGSNNPLGLAFKADSIPFSPYYTLKDVLGVLFFLMIYLAFVFFMPNYLGHSDNFIRANPMVTPTHIVPEWYFLPFYAILRSVPDKLTGVLLLALAIVQTLVLPFYYKPMSRCSVFDDVFSYSYWIYIHIFLWLLYLGAQPIETPFYELSQLFTFLFFAGFLLLGFRERIFIAEKRRLFGYVFKIRLVTFKEHKK